MAITIELTGKQVGELLHRYYQRNTDLTNEQKAEVKSKGIARGDTVAILLEAMFPEITEILKKYKIWHLNFDDDASSVEFKLKWL
jgi:hypothetical protein